MTGTVANINAFIAASSVTFTTALNSTAAVTLTVTTDDLGNSPAPALNDSDSVTLNVTAVNDAPANTVPAAQATNEDTALVFSAGNGNQVLVADVDAGASLIDVTLTVTNGTLTLAGTVGLAFQAGADGTATMTVRGTIADINTAMNGMTYQPVLNYTGAASLTVTTDDRGFTGAGGPLADSDVVNITVNPVNDAPLNTVPGPQAVNEDTLLTFSVAGGNAIAVADVDAATLRVTLAATNGTLSLASFAGLAFSAGDGTADATMTFTGTAAAINAALDGLAFLPGLNYNGPATVAITTEDLGQTGAGGPLQDADVVAITVNAVNDAPVIGANGFAVTDGGTVAIGTANLSATDIDDIATSLVFTVGATNGRFELVSAPGVAITSFTQAQILAGEVRFVHDGSNAPPAITVYVTDGVTNAGPFAMNVSFSASGTTITPPGTGGSGNGGSTPVTTLAPPTVQVQPHDPQDGGAFAFLRAPTGQAADGGDDGDVAEVVPPVTTVPAGILLREKVGVPVMGMPTMRADSEAIDTKPLRSEIEVEPVRAEMQVLPMRRETFDNPDDEERQTIEVVMSSVRITGLAFSVGAVWWAARAAGLVASLLASSPAWRHVDPLPVLGRDDEEEEAWDETAEDEDKDRKDDEHRAAWVLEEREQGS
jgi:hypothetical protein